MAWRSSRSMQTRNAASVFPLPVGAEMSVGIAGEDAGPALLLRLGRRAEFVDEPLCRDGVRPGERGGDFDGRHGEIVARICSAFVRLATASALAYLHVTGADVGGGSGGVALVEILLR